MAYESMKDYFEKAKRIKEENEKNDEEQRPRRERGLRVPTITGEQREQMLWSIDQGH